MDHGCTGATGHLRTWRAHPASRLLDAPTPGGRAPRQGNRGSEAQLLGRSITSWPSSQQLALEERQCTFDEPVDAKGIFGEHVTHGDESAWWERGASQLSGGEAVASVIEAITGEGTGAPFGSAHDQIEQAGGVEEEFLVEGAATMFGLASASTTYSSDGRWSPEPLATAPFRSRFVVSRPADPAAFNGTVLVNWNNVSRGQDLPSGSAGSIADGFAVVGVTTQRVGVFGANGLPGLKEHDPGRYGTLEHPGDGFSYDIFTQVASHLGPDRPRDIDPLGGFEVRHLVATGGSQSANRLATYVNAIQPITSSFDAFLLTVYAGCPCALDPATAPSELPQVPTNSVGLLEWRTYRLRDDLDVPILVLNSEFETEQYHPNNQPDTDTLRFWEVAGTAHAGMAPAEMMDMIAASLDKFCRVSFEPASRAAAFAIHRWLDDGTPPPHQPRLEKQGDP